MQPYPLWKSLLLIVVLAVASLYAFPNLYPDTPAIQISGASAGQQTSEAVIKRVLGTLSEAGLAHGEGEQVGDSWLVRLDSTDAQLKAKELAEQALGNDYVVALNLAPSTPQWLADLGGSPMNLGLDLRGGIHFLLEVDMQTALEQRMDAWLGGIKLVLKDADIRTRSSEVLLDQRKIRLEFDSEEALGRAQQTLRPAFMEFNARRATDEKPILELLLTEQAYKELEDYAVDQNRTALANRVNELGVSEPVVQRQGANRIVIELPGVQDASQARRILGRTATLEFRMVSDHDPRRALTGIAPPGTEIFPRKDNIGPPVILQRSKIVSGDQVTNAQMGFDPQNGAPEVNISLDANGARRMQRITAKNVGNQMAVLFIETKTSVANVEDADGKLTQKISSREERYVINVATIRDTLGTRFRITGLDSPAEASELALLLRAGGLAAPVHIVEERTIGPSLGADNIEAGLKSMALGLALVLVFMVVWYKVFGLIANLALMANLVIVVAAMSLIGATLTLPGIAGIVLTVGMAVDANVLIFERIREELKKGQSPLNAIDAGYAGAFSTIIDANITTLIVAIILFAAGTGTVQGFAVTLFIGILTSMFTAIMGTRSLVYLIYGRRARAPRALSI